MSARRAIRLQLYGRALAAQGLRQMHMDLQYQDWNSFDLFPIFYIILLVTFSGALYFSVFFILVL
jgi:hypothetical protein